MQSLTSSVSMLVCLGRACTQALRTLAPTGIHLQRFNSTYSGHVLFVKRVCVCTFLLCTLLSSLGALLYLRQHAVSKRSSVLHVSQWGGTRRSNGYARLCLCTACQFKVVVSRLDSDTACTV